MQHSSLVDKNYIVVGNHVNWSLRDKIVRGDYIDFAHLLPWAHSSFKENRLELVNRGARHTLYLPIMTMGQLTISKNGNRHFECSPISTQMRIQTELLN